MFDFRRTLDCNSLNKSHIGQKVTLSGWVNKRRDHGGLIFIDLRDRYGLTQIVFDPDISSLAHETASQIRNEWVISIYGEVIPRREGMSNPNLKTGDIEVSIETLEILSKAKNPPFNIFDEKLNITEEIKLKYRYLDLRRKESSDKIVMRHNALLAVRNFLSNQGFLEINTPVLCKSTPEGARDYLVPSRLYPSNFYALPQSPQLFKQLLMIAGMDKYFQIANCFRDEDPRADRQPEFAQIDIEMSFNTPEEIYKLCEELLKDIFQKCLDTDILTPFVRMPYAECMEKYGCDKPDLRFDMEMRKINDVAEKSTFSIFLDLLKEDGIVKGFLVKEGSTISRKQIDEYTAFVSRFNLKGLVYFKKTAEGLSSNIAKFFSEDLLKELEDRFHAEVGDLIFIAAEQEDIVNQALDHLRRKIAKDRNLIDKKAHKFLWVTDFPLFAFDPKEGRFKSNHHPFTSPNFEDMELLDKDPKNVRALAYDLVLNGYEIAGGSQRIHDSELQSKIFKLLNLTDEDIASKFGFFIDALKYGTPPHLGIAFGVDRLIMLLTNTENIRDVIAFPKTLKGLDLMTQAPSFVSNDQLQELKIKTLEEEQINW